MKSEDVRSVHVFVSGRVQGVTYRASTLRAAQQRDVSGWVRNRRDRRVEARFEGSPDNVEALLEWCRQGPPMAKVTELDVTEVAVEGLDGFQIDRTV